MQPTPAIIWEIFIFDHSTFKSHKYSSEHTSRILYVGRYFLNMELWKSLILKPCLGTLLRTLIMLVDVGCHAIRGATDPRRVQRRRRDSCSILVLRYFKIRLPFFHWLGLGWEWWWRALLKSLILEGIFFRILLWADFLSAFFPFPPIVWHS